LLRARHEGKIHGGATLVQAGDQACARLVLLALVISVAVMQTGLAFGQINFGATLTVLSGRVSVVRSNGSAIQPASSGLTLEIGDRVATVGKASAPVTFFDGSEIELGGDTTIAIGEASSDANTFLIEVILGNTVHRVSTLKSPNSSYRIEAGDSVIEVRGTTVGAGIDHDGNVTAFLQEGNAAFDGYSMHNGEACTRDSAGAFECSNEKGKNIWSALTDGVFNGEPKGNPSNTQKPDEDDKKPSPSPSPSPSPDPEGRQP